MEQKNFLIDEERDKKLKRASKKEGKSEGKIIREALDKYFEISKP